MQISAKIDYACKALLELACRWPNEKPMQLSEICKNQKIPLRFLTQIFIQLKQLGYVKSVRGKQGGYILLKDPEQVTLDDIVSDLGFIGFEVSSSRDAKDSDVDIMGDIWQELDKKTHSLMYEINLGHIVQRKRLKEKTLDYSI